MKKQILYFLIGMVFMFGFAGSSNAALISRAGGTMVYDDDLDITWLSDANYGAGSVYDNGSNGTDGRMTWSNAVSWADNLVFGGYEDWRLPTSDTCFGTNCTGSEMGHLFYDELGGTYGSSILPSVDPDLGLFSNIQPFSYWSDTEYAPDPNYAWFFRFGYGDQSASYKGYTFSPWAVRSGDVAAPVPEPGTLLLLGFGLAGLTVYRKKTGRYIG